MTDQIVNVPPELVPRLKQLWNAGLSATECGEELGLTGDPAAIRDAVIRAHQEPSSPKRRRFPTPTADTFWTAERVAALRKLHAEGKSIELISREIGAASRSAIIGKLHRLGLKSQHRLGLKSQRARRDPTRRPSYHDDDDPMFKSDGFDGRPDEADLKIPVEQRRSLLGPPNYALPARAPNECGWPVDDPKDPGFFFCGAPQYPGKHYCAHHCRRAFQPLARRPA